ncbi:hypothetical protein DITRI_Ditri12bG0100600 [Diplodiscus trichospermus]
MNKNRSRGMKDRRDVWHTIFIGRLSTMVSKRALWECFGQYGKVKGVFIPHSTKRGRREFTFGFVRYKYEYEMMKAIELGNNRKIDGGSIVVNKARYSWSKRKQRNELELTGSTRNIKRQEWLVNNNRSYRDAVLGASSCAAGGDPLTTRVEKHVVD